MLSKERQCRAVSVEGSGRLETEQLHSRVPPAGAPSGHHTSTPVRQVTRHSYRSSS